MSEPVNPLDAFRTYSYHHFLYASYHTEGLRKLFSPTGMDVKDITRSANKELQSYSSDFARINELYHNREKIENLSQNPVVLIINPLQDSDFTIESVNYNVMTNGDFVNGTQLITGDLKMVVREPYGASFLNYLKYLSDPKMFDCAWTGITFALKTVIIGHTDTGDVKYFSVKPKILMLRDIESTFDDTGSTYNIAFADMSMGVAVFDANYGQMNKSASLSGATLGEVFLSLQQELNKSAQQGRENYQLKTVSQSVETNTQIGRPVNYQIWLEPTWSSLAVDIPAGAKVLQLMESSAAAGASADCVALEGSKKEAEAKTKAAAASKKSEAEKEEYEKQKKKAEERWASYYKFVKEQNSTNATPDEPTRGMNEQAAASCQCQWLTKWNKDPKNKDDLLYSIPTSPKQLEEEKLKREAAQDKAKKEQAEEQNNAGVQTSASVSIMQVVGEILKRSSALKNDCTAGALTEFNAAKAKLAEAKNKKTAVETSNDTELRNAQNTVDAMNARYAAGNPLYVYFVRNCITSDAESVTVHFDIIKRYLANPASRQAVQVAAGANTPADKKPNGNCITYDHIFTGQNTDVLQYDMKMNNGQIYLANDQLVADRILNTNTPATARTADGVQIANIEENGKTTTGVLVVTSKNGKQVKIIRKNDPLLAPVNINAEKVGMAASTPEAADTHKRYMEMFTKFSAMGALTAGLTIRGNPSLLNSCATTIQPHDADEYSKRCVTESKMAAEVAMLASDQAKTAGTTSATLQGVDELDMLHLPIFIKVNVKMPYGKSSSVGTVNSLIESYNQNEFTPFWYQGWYWVTEIENIFDGEFRQVMKLFAYNVNDPLNAEISTGPGAKQ